jgi:hypothetical protein
MSRWLAFGACAVAVAAVGYGIFVPSLDLPAGARLGVEFGMIDRVPGGAWVFQAITLAGIAFSLFRNGSPRPAALVLAATGVVGAASMLWTIRLLGRSVASDVFGNRIDVVIAPAPWIVVAGFAASVVGGLLLWRAAKPSAN